MNLLRNPTFAGGLDHWRLASASTAIDANAESAVQGARIVGASGWSLRLREESTQPTTIARITQDVAVPPTARRVRAGARFWLHCTPESRRPEANRIRDLFSQVQVVLHRADKDESPMVAARAGDGALDAGGHPVWLDLVTEAEVQGELVRLDLRAQIGKDWAYLVRQVFIADAFVEVIETPPTEPPPAVPLAPGLRLVGANRLASGDWDLTIRVPGA